MPLAVEVHKGPTRRYRSVLHRADGVEVELDGGAYNRLGERELPHDIAHLIVEDELGLDRGVWGVLAAGGLFRGASVRAGRQKPHAARRGREVVAAAVEQLNQAEMLTRAVCDLAGVRHGRPAARCAPRTGDALVVGDGETRPHSARRLRPMPLAVEVRRGDKAGQLSCLGVAIRPQGRTAAANPAEPDSYPARRSPEPATAQHPLMSVPARPP